jgi:hypothetical protein
MWFIVILSLERKWLRKCIKIQGLLRGFPLYSALLTPPSRTAFTRIFRRSKVRPYDFWKGQAPPGPEIKLYHGDCQPSFPSQSRPYSNMISR